MAVKTLKGMNVGILVCDGFEESELTKPKEALENAGANVFIITPKENFVKAWIHDNWSGKYAVNKKLEKIKNTDLDAMVLPGGVQNPDKLRTNKKAVALIKSFLKANKPIAAICHGPWTLIETGLLKNRKVTSYHSIKTDLINAGAHWQNKKVVIDKNLITSRQPSDLPSFNKAIINVFSKKKIHKK